MRPMQAVGFTATARARAAIQHLRDTDGPVVFLVAERYCAGEPMCFGASDYLPSPHDRLLGLLEDCPIYVDRRDTLRHLASALLDVAAAGSNDTPDFLFVYPRTVGDRSRAPLRAADPATPDGPVL